MKPLWSSTRVCRYTFILLSTDSIALGASWLTLDPPQEINVQNMNVELVAQMFKNYQSNVLFHLEGQNANRVLFKPQLTSSMKLLMA